MNKMPDKPVVQETGSVDVERFASNVARLIEQGGKALAAYLKPREQGSATNNIATQVERIAQMSEESSAAAGNSSHSAHELDRLATEMQRIVSDYRL